MIASIAYITVILLLMVITVIMTLKSKRYATAVAYASLTIAALISPAKIEMMPISLWGIAVVMVIAIDRLLPVNIAKSRCGLGYLVGGAFTGMFIGFIIPAVVLCTVAGTILGGIAYAKTPEGKSLEFPSSKFLSYLCAKGFPVVIAICIIGVAITWLFPVFISQNP